VSLATLRARLPRGLKVPLRALVDGVHQRLSQLGALGRVPAVLYYGLYGRAFDREQLAVLRGRQAFWAQAKAVKHSSARLRRNIHRLEKGLIMQPRRPVFGEAFIEVTVGLYGQGLQAPGFSQEELAWAGAVLQEYFAVVASAPAVDRARRAFEALGPAPVVAQAQRAGPCIPQPQGQGPGTEISFDALKQLFVQRRSVRWYRDTPVPLSLIEEALEAASLAPSACNRQPFRFVAATKPEDAARIARCAGGTAGFADQLPAILVAIGDLSAYPEERDRHLIYIDTALASMQFLLAAETQGLSTCAINWPDLPDAERKLAKLVPLAPYERVVMLIAVGYADPAGGVPYSQKKPARLLLSEFRAP